MEEGFIMEEGSTTITAITMVTMVLGGGGGGGTEDHTGESWGQWTVLACLQSVSLSQS